MAAERCTVDGTVNSLIFQNEDNGYTVLPAGHHRR